MIRTRAISQCPICNSSDLMVEIESEDFESRTGNYDILRCGGCGMAFTSPQPIEEDLPKLYEARSSNDFPKVTSFTARLRAISIDHGIGRILRQVNRRSLRVLDYGCGDGVFADRLSFHPDVERIAAVDFHPAAPGLLEQNNTGKITYESVHTFEGKSERFDLICLRHVLEHSADPVKLLRALSRHVTPGGWLVAETPNFESAGKRIFGRFYSALYLPRHLYHFTTASLVSVLQSPWRVELMAEVHTPFWGKSAGNWLGVNISNTQWIGIALFPIQILLDAVCRTSSTLRVVAQAENRP